MIEAISMFLIGLGAVLVSLASTLGLAWLAVLIPVLIAAAAAIWFFRLSRRGRRRVHANRIMRAKRPERRMAA